MGTGQADGKWPGKTTTGDSCDDMNYEGMTGGMELGSGMIRRYPWRKQRENSLYIAIILQQQFKTTSELHSDHLWCYLIISASLMGSIRISVIRVDLARRQRNVLSKQILGSVIDVVEGE